MAHKTRLPHDVAVVVVALLGYAALSLWYGMQRSSVLFALWVVPSLACVSGLLRARKWSRFVLYVLNGCIFGGWSVYMLLVWWWYPEPAFLWKLLALGMVIVVFSLWSARAVRRYLGVDISPSVQVP